MSWKTNLVNLFKYRTTRFEPQVDPEFMEPIFEEELSNLSFYSPMDDIGFWKFEKSSLQFNYSSNNKIEGGISGIDFCGTIHYQYPRNGFKQVDVVSLMRVNILRPDKDGEIYGAINNIIVRGHIEKVLGDDCTCEPETREIISRMNGRRTFEQYSKINSMERSGTL